MTTKHVATAHVCRNSCRDMKFDCDRGYSTIISTRAGPKRVRIVRGDPPPLATPAARLSAVVLPPSLHYNDTDSALSFVPTTEHRKKGKAYEIASGQALNRPCGAQDKHQLGRGFLEWVEGHRHAASSDTVRLGRQHRCRTRAWQLIVGRAVVRSQSLSSALVERKRHQIKRLRGQPISLTGSEAASMPLAIPAASRCWSDLLPLNACGNKPLAGLTSAGVFCSWTTKARRLNSTRPRSAALYLSFKFAGVRTSGLQLVLGVGRRKAVVFADDEEKSFLS
jgi:hypothetical protein